ncbi:hypothetical protein ABZX90_09500 [Streptomyces sp. NPDC002935]|uniref:hypothetical protein n=1 Tax=Streptomyces sp. NPDC002935 TaxID=3154545 RepID=UPI0033A070FF
MTDGFPGRPKILRGAFVEFGLSLPPLLVVFQFNPLQLTRNRSLSVTFPGARADGAGSSLRDYHGTVDNLLDLQKQQVVSVQEQTVAFDIRLDATDGLGDGDVLAKQFGVGPQLATLELMVQPKSESMLGLVADKLLGLGGKPKGFSFTRSANPPLVLFIFGRKRVLPVNINALNITETEFSADLNPIRATAAVSLTVIEGRSVPYLYSKAATEVMSALNLANVTDVANVVIPG